MQLVPQAHTSPKGQTVGPLTQVHGTGQVRLVVNSAMQSTGAADVLSPRSTLVRSSLLSGSSAVDTTPSAKTASCGKQGLASQKEYM